VRCRFCAFSRDEGDPDAYVLTPEEILARVDEAHRLGATHIMLQGGLCRKTGLSYVREVFGRIKTAYPEMTIHSLTAPEIEYLARVESRSIEDVLETLKESGLGSLPGGGAEILSDPVRSLVSPNKINTAAWLAVHAAAHGLKIPSTATMVIGHRETIGDRIEHLAAIRNLQDRTGGFRSFITWIYHPGNTELGGKPTNAVDYLKTIALQRLFLDNIAHLQASWLSIGVAVAQVALHCGADDMGSIMLEENVVRATGHNFPPLKAEDMAKLIHSAGRQPAQRRTDFTILRTF
jgi:cyclic dehypoxanthinyl futalosine synthase